MPIRPPYFAKEQIPNRQFCDRVLRKDALTHDGILRVIRETRHRKL